jgi:ATP-dependent DNA helicase RecG
VAAGGSVGVRSFAGAGELSHAELRDAPVHWPRPSVLEAGLQALDGVGPKTAEAAAEAGIRTVGDLLYHVPHSHRDRRVRDLAELESGEQGTVRVRVLGKQPRPFRKRRLTMVSVKVGDETDSVRATWFNQPWVASKLETGAELILTGKRTDRGLGVSEWELLRPAGPVPGEGPAGGAAAPFSDPPPRHPQEEPALTPVHRASANLRPQQLREWAEQAVRWAPNAIEGLPAELRARRRLAAEADALRTAHFPEREEDVEQARERLAFEELFLHQALLATRKRTLRTARPAPRFGAPGELVARWLAALPFEPTGDQLAAFD